MTHVTDITDETTDAQLDQAAFEAFATAHPHEAFASQPERFWVFLRRGFPHVTLEQTVEAMKETACIATNYDDLSPEEMI